MKNIVSLFVVALVLFGIHPEAHAFQKYVSKTKGNQASFSNYSSDSECSYSGISVWAFQEDQRGGRTSYDSVYVDYYSYDYCSGDNVYGYLSWESASFSMQKLDGASLEANGTMELVSCNYSDMGGDPGQCMEGGSAGGMSGEPTDPDNGSYEDPCSYETVPVVLNLAWLGTGETFSDRSTSSYSSPTSRYRSRSRGQYRDATVTGVFTVDGEQLDLSGGYGSLSRSSSGSFEVYR